MFYDIDVRVHGPKKGNPLMDFAYHYSTKTASSDDQ